LINAIVQQTMVFIAQLATAGGVRAPLANVADQVFRELTRELLAQGLKKKVIADMFGMGLRTYHRRQQAAEQSLTDSGRTVWEAVLRFVQEREPVSTQQILKRFSHDDPEIVSGVLNDFVNSGLVYRAGRGETAVYRVAAEADFQDDTARAEANEHVVWLNAYRNPGSTLNNLAERSGLSVEATSNALNHLVGAGKVSAKQEPEGTEYSADRFEVPWGTARGWEAAVLDHFQAVVNAVTMKLSMAGGAKGLRDQVGGSTWSMDVWEGHPFEAEVKGLLATLREQVERLRQRVDTFNETQSERPEPHRVIVYLGQYLRMPESENEETP
jgi:DNA-binding MarR family transcriptional regulator